MGQLSLFLPVCTVTCRQGIPFGFSNGRHMLHRSRLSLSHRALSLIKTGGLTDLLDAIDYPAIQRGIWLALPPIILTFMMANYFEFYR